MHPTPPLRAFFASSTRRPVILLLVGLIVAGGALFAARSGGRAQTTIPPVEWVKVPPTINAVLHDPGQTFVFDEVMYNQSDPNGLGAFSFVLFFDNTIWQQPQVDLTPAMQLFAASGRTLQCSVIPIGDTQIEWACTSTGTIMVGPVWSGPKTMATVTLVLEPLVAEALLTGANAQVTTQIDDLYVDVANTCGWPLNDGTEAPLPGQTNECQGNLLPGLDLNGDVSNPGDIIIIINGPGTPTPTATGTAAPSSTPSPTATPSLVPTDTPIPSVTPTATNTAVPTSTPTATATSLPPTNTPLPDTATPTSTATSAPTSTNTPTRTATPVPTSTSTPLPPTATATSTRTATATATRTATATATPTSTPTAGGTPTPTPTGGEPGTVGYWKNHPGPCGGGVCVATYLPITLGTASAGSDCQVNTSTTVCTPPMHITVNSVKEAETILWNTAGVDATVKLVNQLLATKLDIAAGRGDPTCLQQTLAQADVAVSQYGYNTNPVGPIRQYIVSLAATLELWNRKGQCAIVAGSGPAVGSGTSTGAGSGSDASGYAGAYGGPGSLPWLDLLTGVAILPGVAAGPLAGSPAPSPAGVPGAPGGLAASEREFSLPLAAGAGPATSRSLVPGPAAPPSSAAPAVASLPDAGTGHATDDGRVLLLVGMGATLVAVLALRLAWSRSAKRTER